MAGSRRSRNRHPSYDFMDKGCDPDGMNKMFPNKMFFRELYLHRRNMFKKMFPNIHNEFEAMSENIEAVLSKKREENESSFGIDKSQSLKRSLSVGSPRVTSRGVGGEDTLTLDRFKVRTVDINSTPPSGGKGDGGGGQSGPKSSGGSK